MQSRSFAPAGRALLFFGFMGCAVLAMTLGSGLQRPSDTSSTTIAQIKTEENAVAAERFAAQSPALRSVQQAAIPGTGTLR